jgi:spore germination cell wall hydrolase CwlJ-like protein
MSLKVKLASAFAMAASVVLAVFGTADGAAAQDRTPIVLPAELTMAVAAPAAATGPAAVQADTLAEMVAAQPQPAELSPELRCLAGAIYFESKGQELAGQLAVGRVVVNRSKSGRFPASYCGVIYQHAQFGFVRGSAMPAIPRSSTAWRTAVAIAQIADADSWHSETEGALYFHAARVAPNWHMTRIARLDDHIFYR